MRVDKSGLVLIVDDDPNLLRIAARVVASAGYQALTAATGQALRLAREQAARPDSARRGAARHIGHRHLPGRSRPTPR